MVKSGIKIFARMRPTKKPTGLYDVGLTEDGFPSVAITVPRSEASGFINNKKEIYAFKFSQVFDQSSKQEEIFEHVARGVIDNCLEGYNGTIFAYGQTGSGKTFTITGGAERYADRGIIPRTLSYLFEQYQKSPGTIFTTHVSYLEIYMENGYDLLDPKHEASKLEDLPKVHLMEDSDGLMHLKNLSMHPATNEEEALNWLFLGDTNRMIAETPMNMASTRSHCIFTIHLTSREPGSDTIKKSKLHLVDLAGSERVGKTGVGGTLLAEAKYINLSLHCLELVIVALSERSRTHIPYRNSMMTSLLRDSLGGNCMTTMIATCSVEKKNIDETISTCRFSQRVALVKNEALLNEELDPKLMVARLKLQVQELREELQLATGEERTEELTPEEQEKCHELVQAYLSDSSPEAKLVVGGDMRKIQYCFQLLKVEANNKDSSASSGPQAQTGQSDSQQQQQQSSAGGSPSPPPPQASNTELQRLQELLTQRDDEINILLKMLKQEKRRAAEAEAMLKERAPSTSSSSTAAAEVAVHRTRPLSPLLGRTSPLQLQAPSTSEEDNLQPLEKPCQSATAVSPSSDSRPVAAPAGPIAGLSLSREALKAELSQARQEAFDSYRRTVADSRGIDQHKRVLKAKYAEAKGLGERVNSARVAINKLKAQIEQQRVSSAVQGLTGSPSDREGRGSLREEEELRGKLENEKLKFKQLYGKLRELKSEIEHIQHLLERARVQLQKDFEQWWFEQTRGKQSVLGSTRSAWRTPPSSSSSSTTTSQTLSTEPRPPSSSSHKARSHRKMAALFPHMSPSTTGYSSEATTSSDTSSSLLPADTISHARHWGPLRDRQPDPLTDHPAHLPRAERIATTEQHHPTSERRSGKELSKNEPLLSGGATTRVKVLFPKVEEVGGTRDPRSRSRGRHTSLVSADGVSSLSAVSPRSSSSSSSLPLTGDSRADADIIAFYKARQKLIQKGQQR